MPVAASFTPRREFSSSPRHPAAFAILSFASAALLRLSNFPAPLVHALRQQLEPVRAFKEDADQNLYEISLNGKPWSLPRSMQTELLVVQVFAFLLTHGYIPLSSIDYGREPDDKQSFVFSKRNGTPSTKSTDTTSTSSFAPIVPFGVSFPNSTTIRVISIPLHSTPGILQAIRNGWPRGISGEMKVAESSYEFKLKGYSILREDTFPLDSLAQTMNLLTSFDSLGFTLLASICVGGSHHRVKDFWIFSGPDEGSNPQSPVVPKSVSPPPIIPPILSEHDPIMTVPGVSNTVPLWDQFARQGQNIGHQRAATTPENRGGIRDAARRDRVQSEGFSTAVTIGSETTNNSKPSVLRKKPPTPDGKTTDKNASPNSKHEELSDRQDYIDMTGVGTNPPWIGSDASTRETFQQTDGAPNRILYSTPIKAHNNPDGAPFDESENGDIDHTLPHANDGDVHVTDGPAVLPSETVEYESSPAAAPNQQPLGGSRPAFSDEDELVPAGPSSGGHSGGQSEEVEMEIQDPMSETLLAPNVFRDTNYTSSISPQPSSNSVPQVPDIPSHGSRSPNANDTPKANVGALPVQEFSSPGPPSMIRSATQASTPMFPGGWAPTPAEEHPPNIAVEDETQHEEEHTGTVEDPPTHTVLSNKADTIETSHGRKSEFGLIGDVSLEREDRIESEPVHEPGQALASGATNMEGNGNTSNGRGGGSNFELLSGSRASIESSTADAEPTSPPKGKGSQHPPSVFKRLLGKTKRLSTR